MNISIYKNQTIVYDVNIISKIQEMIEIGLEKLRFFPNLKKRDDLEFYNDLKERFNNIALKLEELKLWDELKYFLSISHYIEYIIYQNSFDSSFGHCSFTVELLKFYTDFIKINFDFYLNKNNLTLEEFYEFQEETKTRYRQYRRKFYGEIYKLSGDYTTEELYKIHESLRE